MAIQRTPLSLLEDLASGNGGIDRVLRAGQRGKRLLLLHELIGSVERNAPELFRTAEVGSTYAQLAESQRRDRHAVDQVLLQPHVGAWALHCLRHMARGGCLGLEDIGQLGAITAAAALRAGLAVDVMAHPRDGGLFLPTFGSARLMSTTWCRLRVRADLRELEISDGTATRRIPVTSTADQDGWLPLRRLRSDAAGLTIDVELDDLDPFRDCGVLRPSRRLDSAELADWQAKLDEGWALLVADDRSRAEAIGQGVVSFIPLQPSDEVSELSASGRDTIGAMALTAPRRPLSMTLALVHEFQHFKLWALLDVLPLVEQSTTRFHAPWRRDPRPVLGLLHGVYAFLGLAQFWGRHRQRPLAVDDQPTVDAEWTHFEFALLRDQVAGAVDSLRRSGLLTAAGSGFLDGLHRAARALRSEQVPARPLAFARLAGLDNAISWRLRNCRIDGDQVAAWATAWVDGRSQPTGERPVVTVVDGEGPLASERRAALFRSCLARPDTWRDDAPDVPEADVLLVQRRDHAAAEAYRVRIGKDPRDFSAWAGLALCRGIPAPTRWALANCPELLCGVHAAIGARMGNSPDVIDDLAAWMIAEGPDRADLGGLTR